MSYQDWGRKYWDETRISLLKQIDSFITPEEKKIYEQEKYNSFMLWLINKRIKELEELKH